MYKIGIIPTGNLKKSRYTEQFNKTRYQIYPLTKADIFTEASKMDALIIEESPLVELNRTCELILELRRNFKALIWIVSKKVSKTSKIVYLQLGADGVVDVEVEQEEFLLQFSNILNRFTNEREVENKIFSYDKQELFQSQLKLIQNNLSVVLEGKEISLTKLEFQILSILLENKGKAVTYEEIYKAIWQDKYTNSDSQNKQYRISNLIFHLRKKMELDTAHPNYIKTVRSKGYMLMNAKHSYIF
ncbi:two-component system, OmpR family, response regulator VicR [Enterococcus sp. DIV0212c]|uniref:winged helix-turn-helix domain-containing protein n=1 Tax=Enterococcus sp. DIV0212c TaxID=2230867 RepID=UPI001A9B3977|nr:winged helix-turn-helix domain-containing protein [Enterococcus sp. DIV0212c]MBO1355005.1 winged helix-turn-helix domain-containing protein [Enterococcus sp. DIV0212c]